MRCILDDMGEHVEKRKDAANKKGGRGGSKYGAEG